MEPDEQTIGEVLAAWGLQHGQLERIGLGHINLTYRLEHDGNRFILQRLSPIFSVELHLDIEAVTAQLQAAGVLTPRLVPTTEGSLWTTDRQGLVWRLMTYIEGQTLLSADSSWRCHQAGRLVGRFHRALWDFDYEFQHTRLGVHDTPAHLAALERALTAHRRHPNFAAVRPTAEQILQEAAQVDPSWRLPLRVVHGDLKISNILFGPDGRALCLIDLDTLARMPIAVELGDAFRSWCCPRGEEVAADFDLEFFAAGIGGYANSTGTLVPVAEREAIVPFVEVIAIELAARFCADALNESYFGWDRSRFESASEHNLVRAGAQLTLARSVRRQMAPMERALRSAFRAA